jgi:large subunit ribosomal protein L1
MDTSHLEENFSAVLKDVYSMRPNREGQFITKCCLVAPPSPERLKVDYSQYIDEDDNKRAEEEEHDDEEEESETEKSELEKTSAAVVG